MSPVRVGIVGCGDVANFGHAPAINAIEETTLAAVYDPDSGRAAEFARRHGAGAAFDELERFLDAGLDAVAICSPAPAHRSNVEAVAPRGLPILCEKPLADTVESAEAMLGTLGPTPFMVGYVYRFAPVSEQIRAWVESGAIGRVRALRLTYVWNLHGRYRPGPDGAWEESPVWAGRIREGGPMVDCGVHLIDLARWWTGSEVVRVQGHGAWVADYDAPDHVWAHLDHANGAHTAVEASFSYTHTAREPFSEFTYDVIGDGGVIRYDRDGWRLTLRNGEGTSVGPSSSEKGFWPMYQAFAAAVRSGDWTGLPNGQDGLIATKVAQEATREAERAQSGA